MENEYPILEKLKAKRSSYSVPDDYFERLNKRLTDQTKHIQPTSRPKQPLIVKLKPLFYMAAMFAGACVIVTVASDGDSEPVMTAATNETSVAQPAGAKVQLSGYSLVPEETNVRDYTIASMDEYSLYEYYCETSMSAR